MSGTSMAGQRRVQDRDAVSTSTAVVFELAATIGREVTDIEPLRNAVNPDALNNLIDGNGDVEVSFQHENCQIDVTQAGIDVTRLDRGVGQSRQLND